MKPFQTFKTFIRKFCKKFSLTSLDRSRGIKNRSKTLFDRSNKNQMVIESSRSSWIIFLIISIDRVKDLTNWTYWISNFHLENSRTWIFTLSTLWNNILQKSNIIIIIYPCIYTTLTVSWFLTIIDVWDTCNIVIVFSHNANCFISLSCSALKFHQLNFDTIGRWITCIMTLIRSIWYAVVK